MFEILEESSESCIGFKVSGKAVAANYEMLLPRLDEAIKTHGKIDMVVVLSDFDGWGELDAAKPDFHFGKEQYHSVERCAFVSDKKWHRWMVKLMDPFTWRTAEAYFEPAQIQDAWDWACRES